MRITSLLALQDLAEDDDLVREILEDHNLGRKKASEKLFETTDYLISEKLVRTYRKSLRDGIHYVPEAEVFKDSIPVTTPLEAFDYVNNAYATYSAYSPITSTTFLPPVVKEGKARSSRTIVIMPDVQAPLHDQILVDKFVDFLYDFEPNELAQVGDFTDSTEISRWVRGKKPEYAGDLRGGFLAGRKIAESIREVFDGRWRIVRSNHDDRLELYIQSCAAGLASFGDYELSFEALMKFADYDVEFVRDGLVELTEDWVMAHGDEGSLSPQAGKTAFGLAKNKFGVNVVCGHTHRAGITTESYGYNGSIKRTLTGLEVGHFMDIPQAQYLDKKGGTANWQQAFGILETVNGKTFPHMVPVINGNFSFEGMMY